MSDSKIVPPTMPKLDWDTVDPGIDKESNASSKPDASFHDDHVGSHLKNDEAAKARQVTDRFVAEVPRRVTDAQAKVTEAAAFRPAQEDEEARRAERRNRNTPRGPKGRNKRVPRRDPRSIAGGNEPGVDRVEDKIEALWDDLAALTQALDEDAAAQDEAQQDDKPPETEEEAADDIQIAEARALERARLIARQLRLETAAKQQLQLLLAGGIGLSLMGDPRLTFRRLFDLIGVWPKQVVPGKRPETDAEFDLFLAYIFAPPGAEEDVEYW